MNVNGRAVSVFLFIALIILSFLINPSISSGQTAEQYIETGETDLFSETIAGILSAHTTFQAAKSAYTNDPVINVYLAVTRLLELGLREDGTGATDLAARYGVLRSGSDLDTLEFQPTMTGDEYLIVPETAPSSETLRSFGATTLLNDLNASIANLGVTLSAWSNTDKHIVSKTKTGDDLDLEWDYGDICLFRAALKMAKSLLLVATAYDLDVDVREVVALGNIDALNVGKILERYQDLLKLLPTTTTPSGNGATQLADARTILMSAIDDYDLASQQIRNDPGTNGGAQELIAIEACDLLKEELMRERLIALKASLVNGTVFQFTESEETWLFTDDDSNDRLQVQLIDNRSNGEYWGMDGCDFISCSGEIECVVIEGDQVTLELAFGGIYPGYATFTGTLNAEGTQITVGSYSGWNGHQNVSGTFTALRTGVDEEVTNVNLNPVFGNGSGPYSARDLLPLFDCDDEPILGTMGHGLGDDATLGGIFPDFTQDDWGLEGTPASGEISIPSRTINVQDGSLTDWAGIDPVYTDPTGDGYPDRSGSDLQDLYLAKDGDFLYGRMTLADGPPNTAYGTDPWQAMGYFVRFMNQPGEYIGSRGIQVDYPGSGTWRVQVWEQGSDMHSFYVSYESGYAQAVGNDLEFKVPLADLGFMGGKYLTTWIQWIVEGMYGGESPDYNETCLRVGPLTSITVNLTVPDYDGTGLVIVAVFRDDGGYNTLEENRVGDLVFLYPGQYTPTQGVMSIPIDGLPAGETVWVSVRWDADYNGIRTRGDYSRAAGPYTVASDGSTVVNLSADTMYAADQESPYFRVSSVLAFRSQTGIKPAFYAEVYDPNGSVPDSISSLDVTYPDGTTSVSLIYAGGNGYYLESGSGEPPVGEYTFTVTDTEGRSATTYFYFGGGPELPIPGATTLQVSGDESSAVLSWGGVTTYQGNVFFRARIFGQAGNTIWTSGHGPGTSVTIPPDILQQVGDDSAPRWRVEAFDNHTYNVSYHRSVTNQIDLVPDNSSPYYDFAVIFHRKDTSGDWTQVEVIVRDPDGAVPSSIASLEVYDSSDQLVCSLDHVDPQRRLIYDSAFDEFAVKIPGSPTAGVYRFVVRDNQDNTKTTYDYVGPFFSIPVVDSSTYQAWGDPLTPMLTWAAPAGMDRPLYYRVIIEDDQGGRAWGSDRITETAIQVPSGRLQSGVSYTWYVRTLDNKNWGHFSNQGRAEPITLAVNPSPNPYFRWAGVHRRHDADGSFAGLSAAVIDPSGSLPGSLTSLTVESPLGNTYVLVNNGSLESGVSYDSYYGEFFYRAPGTFEPGEYTFTLVKGGFTLTSHDWVGNTPEMPLVDQTTITVSGNPAAPTVSWSGVSGFGGNVYYRLRVQDTMGNVAYWSSRDPLTAQTIPMGRLESGKIYVARVEAQEHQDFVTYNSRSNTAYVWWSTEGGTATGVSGSVKDELGNPIGNLHVYAQAENCNGPWLAGTNTNQNGDYTLYLPPGQVIIKACATCSGLGYVDVWYDNVYNCNDATQVSVMAGGVMQGIDFTLDTAGFISGHVFEDDGETPVPNVHVYAQTSDGGNWVAGTMSDGNGFYSLNVPESTYIVRACATCTGMPYIDEWYENPSNPGVPEPVYVTPPDEISGIDFTLTPQPVPGDMDGNRVLTLADAIVGLQLVAGMTPGVVNNSAHVDLDGKLGLMEVIYVLQNVAGLRP